MVAQRVRCVLMPMWRVCCTVQHIAETLPSHEHRTKQMANTLPAVQLEHRQYINLFSFSVSVLTSVLLLPLIFGIV